MFYFNFSAPADCPGLSSRSHFGSGPGSFTRLRPRLYSSRSFFDEEAALRSMEIDLARQTRKLQRLRLVQQLILASV